MPISVNEPNTEAPTMAFRWFQQDLSLPAVLQQQFLTETGAVWRELPHVIADNAAAWDRAAG